MEKEIALYFRDEFKKARHCALKDSEGYQQILFALERMGSFLSKENAGLGKYKRCIVNLVKQNRPCHLRPSKEYHIEFDRLYEMVQKGRNDALHKGAVARLMTSHSVQLSVMLEDTLMSIARSGKISDYMVRNPVCVYEWQPISFIRQIMLENSFTYLPFFRKEQEAWYVISDLDVAKILRMGKVENTLINCVQSERLTRKATVLGPDTPVCRVLKLPGEKVWPVLARLEGCNDHLLGIITPFDLM